MGKTQLAAIPAVSLPASSMTRSSVSRIAWSSPPLSRSSPPSPKQAALTAFTPDWCAPGTASSGGSCPAAAAARAAGARSQTARPPSVAPLKEYMSGLHLSSRQ